ncbi:MAG: N-acetyltransferase [Desulfobacteraceae bacterium]|nr:MAG: N-acetyltransferase [Desulfobacteraceae bacterium]
MLNFTFLVDPSSDQMRRITALYRSAGWWGRDMPDDPSMVEHIIKGSHCFMIATEDEDVVGMGRAISDKASDAYIQDLTVINSYRGKGIGAEILKRLVSRLGEEGIKWIGLIAEGNSGDFYSHFGFKRMPDSMPMLRILK